MENSTLTRHKETWRIGESTFSHSLDANGDLTTLDFDIHILGGPANHWRSVRLVPRPLFTAMVGSWFEPTNIHAIDGCDNEYLGAFNTDEPDKCYAILRTTPDAVIRMSHILAFGRHLHASVQTFILPDRTSGLITGFTLTNVELGAAA